MYLRKHHDLDSRLELREKELECELIIVDQDLDCNFDIVGPNPEGLTTMHV